VELLSGHKYRTGNTVGDGVLPGSMKSWMEEISLIGASMVDLYSPCFAACSISMT